MRRVVFLKDKLNKHSIRALVAAFEKWFPQRDYFVYDPTKDAIKYIENGDLVLISFASGRADYYKSYSQLLRDNFNDLNIVAGGVHATALPEETLEYFDAIVTGEGEITIKDIVLQSDNEKVTGIIKGTRVENLDDFYVFPRKKIVLGPIEIMRGCPSACAYCQTPQLFKGKLRFRSVEHILEEINFALSRKGFADARFIAPDASSYMYNKGVNLNAIEQLLYSVRELIGNNGKLFYGTFPSELDPSGVSKELVDMLVKYCDNKLMVLGLQSASKRMQRVMHRRSGIVETEQAIELLLDKNFEIVVDLIFGLPYEDEESYNETYKFIERWKGKVTIHSHPYDTLPGSKWANEQPTQVPQDLVKLVTSLQGIGKVFGRIEKGDKACQQ